MKMSKKERDRQTARAVETVDKMKDDSPMLAALAQVGLNALIDEATGFQAVRPKDDLRKQIKARKRKSQISLDKR